jgi:hypothetical protein
MREDDFAERIEALRPSHGEAPSQELVELTDSMIKSVGDQRRCWRFPTHALLKL